MSEQKITVEEYAGRMFEEIFPDLKKRYQDSPIKLKLIESYERKIVKEEFDVSASYDLMSLIESLNCTKKELENPLLDEKLEITGFAKLVKDISEYDSDTFSAEGSKITPEECLNVANKIVDSWSSRCLDGMLISNFLESIRGENAE